MPRIMTMNSDHQTVATAPLDLRTTYRERGSSGSRSPDCGVERSRQGHSPAPPASTGTNSLEAHCPAVRSVPDSRTGVARKRPADSSSLKLPFRKRPILVEPEIQTQSPAPPENGDRLAPVEDTDLACRESLAVRLERAAEEHRVGVAPVTPRRIEETQQSPDRCPIRLLHPIHYGHYPVYYLPPVPEPNHPLAHQTDNLLAGIALATHQDEDGDTALHIAVVQGELAIVCTLIQLLLWARRGIDIYNNLRQTPLHLAVITQQADMVDVLLRAGADPAALDRNGQTALHLCCEYNQRECLSVVLSRSSSSTCLESRNYEGLSPLHLAVLLGHKDLARMLLDAGADINAMDIKSGQSPLMHAVESNNVDMVHFLIENGCDVNSQSYSGNTALHSACGRGQVDTVRLLLKSGADSSLKNYHNDTPVMVAKNKKIADVLRGRGSKHIRVQDQHSVSVSPHRSMENGSPSPSQSRGCSPSTTPHTLHHGASQSPKTPSMPGFPLY
ncbi:B-cell lymphoma 3 protein homolog [Trachinotus anak]|uniref:B-cell lymphoma 3 protein homolog n=1 Tax=Trachinotus anak TaxID=443729 RepID=UPI0039F23808